MLPFQGIVLFIVIYCQIIFAAEMEVAATTEASPGQLIPVALPPTDPVRAAEQTLELDKVHRQPLEKGWITKKEPAPRGELLFQIPLALQILTMIQEFI